MSFYKAVSPSINVPRLLLLLVVPLLALFPASAATLNQETLNAWDEYVRAAQKRVQDQVNSSQSFFASKGLPGQMARLRNGEVLVSPMQGTSPHAVPYGLIHDWVGAVYIPDTNIDQLLPVIRDYDHYKQFYSPSVLDSKAVRLGDDEDLFSVVLASKSFYRKRALESEYKLDRFRITDRRGYSIAETTRVQEIGDYGLADQHVLAEDESSGMIWRMFTIMRFEERDGGVYLEVEAIALSRDIPVSVRWIVEPIVRRVAKSSLIISLGQTRDAVRSDNRETQSVASRYGLPPGQ